MLRSRFTLLTAFLLVFLMTADAFAQQWMGRGRLNGQVKNEQGEPIVGAKISLEFLGAPDAGGPDPLLTDKKGRWKIGGLGHGQWKLVVEADGYVPREGNSSVNEFGANPPIQLELRVIPKEQLEAEAALRARSILDEANALVTQEKFPEARAKFEEAIQEGLEQEYHAAILLNMAATYARESDYENSIEKLEESLALDGENATALQMMVDLLMSSGREEEAQVYLERLPEGGKIAPDSLLNMGIKLYNENDLPGALEFFNRTVEENPDLADAYYYRGMVNMANQSNPEAITDFEKLIELAPDTERSAEAQQFLEYLKSLQ